MTWSCFTGRKAILQFDLRFFGAKRKDRLVDMSLCRILKDLFISSIQLSWTWVLFNFFASFVCSWAFFAVIWYNIALIHGESVSYIYCCIN